MPAPARRRSPIFAYFGLACLLLLTGSAGSCSPEARSTTPPAAAAPTSVQVPALPPPDLRLLVITDLDGYLEPCGCTSRPLGGIDRMAARVAAVRGDGVPSVFVSAGNVFFHGAPHGAPEGGSSAHGASAEDAAAQEIWRAETVTDILGRLELAAAAPGALDFGFGTDVFERLAASTRFSLLAAGVELRPAGAPPASPILAPSVLRRVGDLQVGIVGLTDLEAGGSLPDRVHAGELLEPGRAAVRSLRERGAQIVIALVSAERRTARRLATGIEGVDFVVQGGLDVADPAPPAATSGAVLLHAARQGHGVTVVDLWRRGEGSFRDVGSWAREAQQGHLTEQMEELRARIVEWESDANVDRADLARQRARLERLEEEAVALMRAPAASGNLFSARFEVLDPEAPRDEAIGALVDGYDQRVNEHNQRVFAEWRPDPAPEGQPHYVGSRACAGCHETAARWWRTTPHARAYATLADQNKQFNLSCVGCHVTGYLRPGGSSVAHVGELAAVGCESCHGPASMHARDPDGTAVGVVRATAEAVCVVCHNTEHSDAFNFDTYRSRLIVPGHGLPPARRGSPDTSPALP